MSVVYDQLIQESTDVQSEKDLLLIVSQLMQFHPDLGDSRPWLQAPAVMDRLEQWLQLHNHMPQP
jgi:hypothetical protein